MRVRLKGYACERVIIRRGRVRYISRAEGLQGAEALDLYIALSEPYKAREGPFAGLEWAL